MAGRIASSARSRTSRARATPPAPSRPRRARRATARAPCTSRKPSASAAMVSSNDGPPPEHGLERGHARRADRARVGNTRRSRSGAAPSMTEPCWRKPAPCRRCALPTTLSPATSSSYEPVRAKQKAGIAAGSRGLHRHHLDRARPGDGARRRGRRRSTDTSRAGRPRPRNPRARRHAVRQLEVGPLVQDRAAAGGPAHEADAERGGGRDVDALVEGLAVAERDGGGLPGEEAERRRARPREPAQQEGLVEGHVRRAVERLGDQQAERESSPLASPPSPRGRGSSAGATSARAGARPASGPAGAPAS